MFQIELVYPIHTLKGRELVSANTLLTSKTVRDLIATNSRSPADHRALMQLEPVKHDILGFFDTPPYKMIFASPEDNAEVMLVLEQVRVLAPVLEALEYFREHDFHTYRHTLMVFALATLVAKQPEPA